MSELILKFFAMNFVMYISFCVIDSKIMDYKLEGWLDKDKVARCIFNFWVLFTAASIPMTICYLIALI